MRGPRFNECVIVPGCFLLYNEGERPAMTEFTGGQRSEIRYDC
ncbi:hypothetical protein [Holdemania filiformis]|uniref:Uncharacterized protein n=1 Tax=Holdemania filiformis DSM 12042 TaxID=545696 RepID=B9Y5C8_9FIRM|nr:hypothetical protein HOLDEFILI_01010 [Holdemania filiformis DSM 12042]